MRTHTTAWHTALVIDPDLEAYTHLCRLAATEGLHLQMHTNATAALRSAQLHKASAVLLAAELPDGSGFELLSRLRQRRSRLPICLITRTYCADDERLALRCQATLYASKPLDIAQLMQFLRHATRMPAQMTMAYPSGTAAAPRQPVISDQTSPLSAIPPRENSLPRGSDRAPP